MTVSGMADKIKELEKELSATKYNKATEHHFAMVKAQIAKLKEKMETRISSKKGGEGFSVKKSGDATVVFVGFPSVGKSTLLNKLTGANSRVAAYAFTTLDVHPGMLVHKGAQIQILDVPGIIAGAASGKGRGKEVLAMVRACDLVILLIDATHPEHHPALLEELRDTNIRPNQQKPHIRISKNKTGKMSVTSTVKLTKVSLDSLKTVMKEMRMMNTDIVVREDVTLDQFMDVVEGNKVYIPMVTAISKIDLVDAEKRKELIKTLKPDAVISAETGEGIEHMKDVLYAKLRFMRVYLKEIGKEPDMKEPMIVRAGSTIEEICRRIHRDFVTKFNFARVWGTSAKFPGQQFMKLDKELHDKDVLELHLK